MIDQRDASVSFLVLATVFTLTIGLLALTQQLSHARISCALVHRYKTECRKLCKAQQTFLDTYLSHDKSQQSISSVELGDYTHRVTRLPSCLMAETTVSDESAVSARLVAYVYERGDEENRKWISSGHTFSLFRK